MVATIEQCLLMAWVWYFCCSCYSGTSTPLVRIGCSLNLLNYIEWNLPFGAIYPWRHFAHLGFFPLRLLCRAPTLPFRVLLDFEGSQICSRLSWKNLKFLIWKLKYLYNISSDHEHGSILKVWYAVSKALRLSCFFFKKHCLWTTPYT